MTDIIVAHRQKVETLKGGEITAEKSEEKQKNNSGAIYSGTSRNLNI